MDFISFVQTSEIILSKQLNFDAVVGMRYDKMLHNDYK